MRRVGWGKGGRRDWGKPRLGQGKAGGNTRRKGERMWRRGSEEGTSGRERAAPAMHDGIEVKRSKADGSSSK